MAFPPDPHSLRRLEAPFPNPRLWYVSITVHFFNPTRLPIWTFLHFNYWFKPSPLNEFLVTCQLQTTASDLPFYNVFALHNKFLFRSSDDVISCDLWFGPPHNQKSWLRLWYTVITTIFNKKNYHRQVHKLINTFNLNSNLCCNLHWKKATNNIIQLGTKRCTNCVKKSERIFILITISTIIQAWNIKAPIISIKTDRILIVCTKITTYGRTKNCGNKL